MGSNKKSILPKVKTRFLKVKCEDCMNEQIIFNKANLQVNCLVCGATIATPTGGKAEVRGKVLGVVDKHG